MYIYIYIYVYVYICKIKGRGVPLFRLYRGKWACEKERTNAVGCKNMKSTKNLIFKIKTISFVSTQQTVILQILHKLLAKILGTPFKIVFSKPLLY